MMAGSFAEGRTCSGHSACKFVFSVRLSTPALCLHAGSLTFDWTGNHGSGEHRVSVMILMMVSCPVIFISDDGW